MKVTKADFDATMAVHLAAMLVASTVFVSPVAAVTRGKTASLTFEWPAQGTLIIPLCGRHGIDLAVPPGAAIHAAQAGRVAYAGSELKGFPNLVLVRHIDGWVSAYALNDEIFVKRGDWVERGQVIATAGRGSIEGRPFHFELRHGSKAVDPLVYLGRKGNDEPPSGLLKNKIGSDHDDSCHRQSA
jgi:murein DD-endopeptidase MepM/ murein hydrolase activator NlpD